MSEVRAWLQGRRPVPPMSLEHWLDGPAAGDSVAATLSARAGEALAAARARPGRVRQSAFDLLAADALLTYACEAAVDSEDPHAALEGLVANSASRDP